MMVPKFRAYIKDTDDLDYNDVPHKGHFVYGNLIKGKPNDDVDAIVGNLIEINDEYVNVEFWKSIEKGSSEQSTGLKDVNGKDIYEGDIVKVVSQYWGQLGNRYKVKFEQGTFCVKYELLSKISKSILVIGNVHENPELLETQHD